MSTTAPTITHVEELAPATEPPGAREHVSGAFVLSVTMLGVSAANYALNLVLARFLTPSEFGDANLAVNLVLAAAAAAATLQLLSARSGSEPGAAATEQRRMLMRWAFGIGCAVGFVMVAGAGALTAAFDVSTPWLFVVIGLGLPVYLAQAVLRGSLQGEMRLGALAATYVAEAVARVGLAVAMLLLGFGVLGAAVAISLSFVASAVVAGRRSRPVGPTGSPVQPGVDQAPGMAAVSVSATVLLVGQVVIANGDVMLAKLVMDPASAGSYAAAAVIGRALYFLSWSVVHSTFPLVARAADREARRRALWRALAMVVSTCVVGVAGLALLGRSLAPLLLGEEYAASAGILVPYAIATSLFAIANLVASVDLAAGRWRAPSALLAGAALQTLLLISIGSTPMSMVQAQVAAMILTVVAVAAAHRHDETRPMSTTPTRESLAAVEVRVR